MKTVKSLSEQKDWKDVLLNVLYITRKTLDPVIVIREDSPVLTFKMRQFFLEQKMLFTRLGVTCSLENALAELLYTLDDTVLKERDGLLLGIETIVHHIANSHVQKHQSRFIIDDCHHLTPGHLFYLLGLVMGLERRVQFLFFFTDENFRKWKLKNAEDKRFQFFINNIMLKYDIQL